MIYFFCMNCLWGNMAGTVVRIFVFVFACLLAHLWYGIGPTEATSNKKTLYIGNEHLWRRLVEAKSKEVCRWRDLFVNRIDCTPAATTHSVNQN